MPRIIYKIIIKKVEKMKWFVMECKFRLFEVFAKGALIGFNTTELLE